MGTKPPLKIDTNNAWKHCVVVSLTPRRSCKMWNFSLVKFFVKMSAICSKVGQYCKSMTPSWIKDLNVFGLLSLYMISTKLQCTLIITWNDYRTMKKKTVLSEKVMQPNGLNCNIDDTSYSFSVDDKVMANCFFLDQQMGSGPKLRMYPEIDLWSMLSPTQLESVYQRRSKVHPVE